MGTRRTREEIEKMIQALERSKTGLPEFNFFGDPVQEITDAQIDVLKGNLTTEDEIYDLEDELGEGNHISVLTALWWLHGDASDEDLIDE